MFGNYSKLIGAFVGNVVGFIFVWLAAAGLAECTSDIATGDQVCSIWGFTTTEVTTGVMAIFNMFFVWAFPANAKPKETASTKK